MTDAPDHSPTFQEVFREWARFLLIAILLWLVLRTFLVEAYRIPTPSMENTLLVGDHLFVNKAVFGPEIPLLGIRLPALREPVRGEVLVFDSVEEEGRKVVKRLIGLPGDTLAMHGGELYRDGLLVSEPYALRRDGAKSESPDYRLKMRSWQLRYVVGDTTGYAPDLHDWGPLVVPPGQYFMMGDNRDDSYDGRYWGFLPRANVRGTPLVIYYSYDPAEGGRFPALSAIRWDRVGLRPR